MVKIKLKPCPFCGDCDAYPDDSNEYNPFYFVVCDNCAAAGPASVSEDESIYAWNRRRGDD